MLGALIEELFGTFLHEVLMFTILYIIQGHDLPICAWIIFFVVFHDIRNLR